MRGCGENRCVSLLASFLQSIVRYPSTDVGVGRLDDSGVGTPSLHELDNMDVTDASRSGNPWYPLECFVVSRRGGCFMQVIECRCSKSIVIVLAAQFRCEWRRGDSAYVGRSEDREHLVSSSEQCMRHSL